MVTAYHPQKFRRSISANTNYPPQIFDESGSGGTLTFNDVTYVSGGVRGSTAYVSGGQRGKEDYADLIP